MDETAEAAKKATLLMIPYGLYVLTVRDGDEVAAGTINWITQTSFKPPLIAMGVKADSSVYALLARKREFALSFLESGQKDIAFAFFKPTVVEDGKLSGQPYEAYSTGAPVLTAAPNWIEGRVVGEVAVGDHACVVAEVVNAGQRREARLLTLEEVGVKYGG